MPTAHLPRRGLPLVTPDPSVSTLSLGGLHLDERVYANRSTGKGRKKWPFGWLLMGDSMLVVIITIVETYLDLAKELA